MSILSKIKSWTTDIGEYHEGRLYRQDNLPLYGLVKRLLSRVELVDEHVETFKTLSQNGVVVYALKNKSQLNSLIIRELAARKDIPSPAYCHGINMILWQPFPMSVKVVLSYLFHRLFKRNTLNACKSGYLGRMVREGKCVIIHLGGSEWIDNPFTLETITELIRSQKNMNEPVYIVPLMITYGRRREKQNESLFNILFGQTEGTGTLRRLVTFLRYSNQAAVIPADSVNLADFIRENENVAEETLCHELRGELIDRIDAEKTSIVGPALKSREEMVKIVLGDENLGQFMQRTATETGKDYDDIAKEVKKYILEIAADYSETFIEIWDKLLTWLWNNIYDGVVVDRNGLAKIRNISKKMPFVIIPCHRSHIDYLLLSYILFKYNIQMPFVAAGTNLMFWPLGYIFRKSGAFFLRRTFKGNALYGEVFSKYLETLLKEGLPIEFFIEGGRSRTGKMVMPKYGLLSMLIQAFKNESCEDLAAIPVYIGYDRVIEEKAYLKELGGEPKAKEKTSDVIKSRKLLRKRYGRVYMNIGEPIFLKSYLASQEKTFDDMTLAERQSLYRKIGNELVLRINHVSVVTPFSLVASGLLCHDRRGISHDDLMDVLRLFYDYLTNRGVSMAETLFHREKAIGDALALFDQSDIISKMGKEEDEQDEMEEIVYSLEDNKRLNLEYYKNNILHYFIPVSFVAASLIASDEDTIPLNQLLSDYQFFKRLFCREFIFDEKIDDLDEVNDVLAYLNSRGMITGFERDGKAWIEMKGRGRVRLMPFAGLIHNYFESLWVVMRGCFYLKRGAKPEKDWLKSIQRLGEKMYKKGEIRRSEALSQSNYQNAIRFLHDEEVLTIAETNEKGEKKEMTLYFLTENRAKMETLRRRLFNFL
jgi:glycerol-3-phosphate O-acyltransferase